MTRQTFTVKTESDIAPCVAWLKAHLFLGVLEVTASTQARGRSANQHRLLWLWNTELAAHMGLFKDEIHGMLKRKFAVPIFTRDDDDYAAMVHAVKGVRKSGMVDYAEALAKEISRLTSTCDFSTTQMSEFLHDVEMYAAEVGARLSFPEELYDSK